MPKLHRIGARFPVGVLVFAAVLTFLSLYAARCLKIENDLASLLPGNLESVQNLERLKNDFGGLGHLLLAVESPDPSRSARFAERLEAGLREHPEVLYVDYRRPVDYFKKRLWLYVDPEDLAEIEGRVDRALVLEGKGVSPVFSSLMDFADPEDRIDLSFDDIRKKYEDKYEKRFGIGVDDAVSSADGTLRVLRVKLKNNPQSMGATKKLISDFRSIEAGLKAEPDFRDVSVGYTGSYQKTVEQADLTRKEIGLTSAVVTVLLLLILIAYFRSVTAALFVAIPVLLGILWTGGAVALVLGRLNIITSFAAAILAGLGSDYGIYLLTRFYEERRAGADFETAHRLAFAGTGKATYLSMVTTVGSFAALLFSDFSLFFEFGVVGSVGLLLNYAAMMLVLPALLKLESRWRKSRSTAPVRAERFGDLGRRVLGRISGSTLVPRRRPLGAAVMVLLCLAACTALPTVLKIHFDDGQVENRKLPSYRTSDRIGPLFPLSTNPTVLMIEGGEREKEAVRTLEALVAKEKGNLVFNHVFGESTFIPEGQVGKQEVLKRILKKSRELRLSLGSGKKEFLASLEDSADAEAVTRENLPPEVRRMFESSGKEGVYAVYLNPSFGRVSAPTMRRYHDGVEDARKKSGLAFEAADGTFVSNDIVRMIEREAPRGMALILLLLSAVLFLQVRPFKRALLIAVNLFASLILLAGVLWLTGIRLNIINIAVIPVILGTGIDCFIHLSQRIEGGLSVAQAVRLEIPAIFISNLTSMVGFGGLILTSSEGIRSAGWVAVLGIGVVMLVCAFFFPLCLALFSSEASETVPVLGAETAET